MRIGSAARAVCAVASVLVAASNGHADSTATVNSVLDAPRPWLSRHGITPGVSYVGETFLSLRGFDAKDMFGSRTYASGETVYRGLLGLSLTLETDGLGLWTGGRMHASAHTLHQNDIDLGTWDTRLLYELIQPTSNIDAGEDLTQLTELWYEHSFLDERVRLKAGLMEANADFAYAETAADFLNSSFGMPPMMLIPSFPMTNLGAAAFVRPFAWLQFRAGLYEGEAYDNDVGVGSHGEAGVAYIGELRYEPKFGADGTYAGTYRVGHWRHTGDVKDLSVCYSDASVPTFRFPPCKRATVFDGNHGIYAMAEQVLYQAVSGRQIAAFAQYASAPDETYGPDWAQDGTRTVSGVRNAIGSYYGGGLVFTGATPWRTDDVLGIGLVQAEPGTYLGHAAERVYEAYLKVPVATWLSLTADVQYVVNPAGYDYDALDIDIGDYYNPADFMGLTRSGIVGGMRVVIEF